MINFPVNQGFTLLELLTVIIIVGILSSTALPIFSRQQSYIEQGVYLELLATLHYAQKQALFSQCTVRFTLTSLDYQLSYPDGCQDSPPNSLLYSPDTQQTLHKKIDTHVHIQTDTKWQGYLDYHALGTYNVHQHSLKIGKHNIYIEAITGYSH